MCCSIVNAARFETLPEFQISEISWKLTCMLCCVEPGLCIWPELRFYQISTSVGSDRVFNLPVVSFPNLVDFENCQQRGQVKTRFYNLNDLKTQLIEYKFTISKNDLNSNCASSALLSCHHCWATQISLKIQRKFGTSD